MKISRRNFIRLGLLTALAALGGKGFLNSRNVVLEKVDVRLPRLPQILDGLKIGVIGDIHAGPLVPRSLIREGVDLLLEHAPDLILCAGDVVSGATRFLWTTYGGFKEVHFRACIEELSRLKAPLGQFCVLGNHDFWSGPSVTAKLARGIENAGFRLLRNDSVRIEEGLYLCGVDDYWEKSYNLTAAMGKVPADACRILLSHNPDVNEDVDARGEAADFIISGHTHGGQIVLPFIGAPFLPSAFGQKYRAGLVKDGSRYTYTIRGLGVFFIPVRLNCPPEVTLITLKTPRPSRIAE